jgi:large subunit ribosomal protein L10
MTANKTEGVSLKAGEGKTSARTELRASPRKTTAGRVSKSIELKKKQVAELQKLIEKSKTIGLINLENLPSKQLKAVRKKLKGTATFVFGKKNIIKRSLEGSTKETVKVLLKHVDEGIPCLILSDLDAFRLFRELKSSRQKVAAKPGQIAPEDISIEAGPTPFAPGPAISELASLGLKTKVEGGKIHVRDSAIVVRKGQPIAPVAASVLAKLGVAPIQIGVNMPYVLEGDDLYAKSVLDVDVEQYAQDLKTAALNAFKLAIELGLVNTETAEFLVKKAFREAKAVSEKLPQTQ